MDEQREDQKKRLMKIFQAVAMTNPGKELSVDDIRNHPYNRRDWNWAMWESIIPGFNEWAQEEFGPWEHFSSNIELFGLLDELIRDGKITKRAERFYPVDEDTYIENILFMLRNAHTDVDPAPAGQSYSKTERTAYATHAF